MTEEPASVLGDLLALEPVAPDTYRARQRAEVPFGPGRLFGGQVASQALRAATCTVEAGHAVNSLHAYFLRPGRFGVPVDYVVDRIRDGRSFTTRRVVALQEGDAILNLDASFHLDEPGEEHQPPSPVAAAGPPGVGPRPLFPPMRRDRPVEMREAAHARPGVRAVWVRVPGRLPDDPSLHACLLTFLSDMGPVGVVSGVLEAPRGSRMMASLDHCMWFHHPVRADEWLLYELEAVATARARGVARGSLWTAEGVLAVTLVQEVLARPRQPLA
ncbi:MAG TPA: acyl-CoA thioesterase domain-containing protein [Acidimicrobiales bacterium]|nr:acyl-CoA thioesterase domain-containing protein [Acidimicrobiales bacterium]